MSILDQLTRPAWLTSSAWPWPTYAITTPTGRIAVTDTGAGPVLLLVHTGTWSFVWRDLLRVLSPRFRCVALDSPGCGLSTLSSAPATLSDAATAVRAVIDELDLHDVTLVAHDIGGPVGLGAAVQRPDRVAAIAALNCYAWRPEGAAFRGMLTLMGSGAMRTFDARLALLPLVTSGRFGAGRHWDRQDRAIFRAGIDTAARRTWHDYFADAHRADEFYSTIEVGVAGPLADRPLLTVFGEHNDPLHLQGRWLDRFPRARQEVIPGGFHFPMCDAPRAVGEMIADWHATAVHRHRA